MGQKRREGTKSMTLPVRPPLHCPKGELEERKVVWGELKPHAPDVWTWGVAQQYN